MYIYIYSNGKSCHWVNDDGCRMCKYSRVGSDTIVFYKGNARQTTHSLSFSRMASWDGSFMHPFDYLSHTYIHTYIQAISYIWYFIFPIRVGIASLCIIAIGRKQSESWTAHNNVSLLAVCGSRARLICWTGQIHNSKTQTCESDSDFQWHKLYLHAF